MDLDSKWLTSAIHLLGEPRHSAWPTLTSVSFGGKWDAAPLMGHKVGKRPGCLWTELGAPLGDLEQGSLSMVLTGRAWASHSGGIQHTGPKMLYEWKVC